MISILDYDAGVFHLIFYYNSSFLFVETVYETCVEKWLSLIGVVTQCKKYCSNCLLFSKEILYILHARGYLQHCEPEADFHDHTPFP
jgi:hypothetical protein